MIRFFFNGKFWDMIESTFLQPKTKIVISYFPSCLNGTYTTKIRGWFNNMVVEVYVYPNENHG